MDADHAGQHGWNHRAGELVNELSEDGVFLRRAADDGEWPDGTVAVVNVFDAQHREVVLQAVVTEMVPEWSFGQQLIGDDSAGNAEVGIGVDWECIVAGQRTLTPALSRRERGI